jgi:hypothetical protein
MEGERFAQPPRLCRARWGRRRLWGRPSLGVYHRSRSQSGLSLGLSLPLSVGDAIQGVPIRGLSGLQARCTGGRRMPGR